MPHQRSIVLPRHIKKKNYILNFVYSFFLCSFAATCFISYTSSEQGRKPNKKKSSVFSNSSPSKSLLSSKSSLLGFILNLSLSLCIYLSANYHKKKQKPQFFFHTLQKSQLINPTNSDSLHSHVLKPILTSHTSFLILSCI